MIESLRYQQDVIRNWQEARYGKSDPEDRLHQVFQEFDEVRNEVILHEDEVYQIRNPEKLAEESVDVIIALHGVIAALGYDIDTLFKNKVEVMNQKYNIDKLKDLQSNGYSVERAMKQCKVDWGH